MIIELKIKAKHLALEPGIIRNEEKKLKAQIKYLKKKDPEDRLQKSYKLSSKLSSLIWHRRWDVCNEARATNLARTYLAGKPYTFAEKKRKADKEDIFQRIIIPRITAMVKKYGNDIGNNITDATIHKWSTIVK